MIPTALTLWGTVVRLRDNVKLLGVTLDSAWTMDQHITEVYTQLQLSYVRTPAHQFTRHTTAGTRRRQIDRTQHFVFAPTPPRLRQHSASNIDGQQVVEKIHNSLRYVRPHVLPTVTATELRPGLHWLPVNRRQIT